MNLRAQPNERALHSLRFLLPLTDCKSLTEHCKESLDLLGGGRGKKKFSLFYLWSVRLMLPLLDHSKFSWIALSFAPFWCIYVHKSMYWLSPLFLGIESQGQTSKAEVEGEGGWADEQGIKLWKSQKAQPVPSRAVPVTCHRGSLHRPPDAFRKPLKAKWLSLPPLWYTLQSFWFTGLNYDVRANILNGAQRDKPCLRFMTNCTSFVHQKKRGKGKRGRGKGRASGALASAGIWSFS